MGRIRIDCCCKITVQRLASKVRYRSSLVLFQGSECSTRRRPSLDIERHFAPDGGRGTII